MRDGLVRKRDVIKVVTSYLAECVDEVENDVDALKLLKYGLDLAVLIENMKDEKGDS